jgi:hypothetical protein
MLVIAVTSIFHEIQHKTDHVSWMMKGSLFLLPRQDWQSD